MKRILLVWAAVVGLVGVAPSTNGVEAASSSYWSTAGGGGGPLFTQLYFDLDAVNKQIQEAGHGAERLNGSLYLFGGGGFSGNYNVRIGGGGGRGDLSSESGSDHASLGVGYGYFDLAFTSPVNSSLTIMTGGRFGGGRATLSVGSDRGSVSFGLVSPYVELERKVSPSIAFVGNVGYMFPFQVGNGSGTREDLILNPNALSGWTIGLALRFGSF